VRPPETIGAGEGTERPLLLASASPRRRELLEALGIPFEVAGAVPFRELTERDNAALSPSEFVWYNALGKGLAAGRLHPERHLLAADTIVRLGPRLFGKPKDRAEASAALAALSGKFHVVETAVVAVRPGGGVTGGIERTRVLFRALSARQIGRYLDAVDVSDKAGSYAIQDHGEWIVERIEGSFSNVVGLPLERVAALLAGLRR